VTHSPYARAPDLTVTLSLIAVQYLTFFFHQHTEAKDVITSKNWDTHRQIIQDKVNLSIHEDIELETNNLLSLLQHAAKEVTPNSDPQRIKNNVP
jgi:hypothetical protein